MKRKDDKKKQRCFHSIRMFKEEGNWFFRTREGNSVGPFRDELEASTRLEIYIRLIDAGLLPASEQLSQNPITLENAG